MESQKIVNLLNDSDDESSKFATKMWYVIHDQNGTDYSKDKENNIKFVTKSIKSSLCNYSDAYILVTGDITATNGDENTDIAFKNCAPFTKYITHINNEHIDTVEDVDITVSI